jgi:hypothetical protein
VTPDNTAQFRDDVSKKRVTEAEARRIGHAAQRIAQFRDALTAAKSGSITVSSGNGSMSIALTQLDLVAALAILIEREALFLTSFGVTVEEYPL